MRTHILLFAVVLAIAQQLDAALAIPTEAQRRFHAVLDAADEDDLRLNPQSALLRGDMRFAGEFGDLISDAYFAHAEANLIRQLSALARVDRAVLDPKERIAYDVFKYQTEFALSQHREGILRFARELPIDHAFGQHLVFQQLSSGAGAAPYKTAADFENGLKRFDGFVTYLDRAVSRMKEGLRDGRVQPRVITEKVIAQLDAELANRPEDSPFYQPLRAEGSSLSASEKGRFGAAYKKAIATKLHPALRRMRHFIAGPYLAAGRKERPGVSALPGGAAYYESQLEFHTTTKMPAEEIHRIGLAEVTRIRSEMDAVRREVGFSGDYQSFVRHLQSSEQFQFASQEALLESYRAIQRRVDEAMPRLFSARPRTACEIRPVPKEQVGSASGAYYIIGTPDGSRPGVFFVNTSNLPTRTTPRMTALYLHEGVPGHHLQGSLAAEDESLPALLRFNWNPGFGEGWALYAEWLGSEMGLYEDRYQYFGRLDMEIIRAVRLVVDTGLHAKSWSRRQAIEYMLANTTLDLDAVEQEVDRYIVWPGQATAYKVGELFIRNLRARAERELGADFDVRTFHAAVLDSGALPLHVLGRKIESWIDDERRRAAKARGNAS